MPEIWSETSFNSLQLQIEEIGVDQQVLQEILHLSIPYEEKQLEKENLLPLHVIKKTVKIATIDSISNLKEQQNKLKMLHFDAWFINGTEAWINLWP